LAKSLKGFDDTAILERQSDVLKKTQTIPDIGKLKIRTRAATIAEFST
jgi:hypothetical protein